jgi:N utilization substance protein A
MPGYDGTDEVIRLLTREVPEVADGTIQIKAIARRPGLRTKIVVWSRDPAADAVGACVGMRGSRIKNVIDVLDGERIDIVRWNASPEVLITNLLQPAAIERVILHPAEHRATVVVPEDQLALARGRGGLN